MKNCIRLHVTEPLQSLKVVIKSVDKVFYDPILLPRSKTFLHTKMNKYVVTAAE